MKGRNTHISQGHGSLEAVCLCPGGAPLPSQELYKKGKLPQSRIRHGNPNYLQEVLKRIMNLSILSNILNINCSKSLNSGLGALYKLEQLQQKKMNVVSTLPHRVWPWGQIQSNHIYHPPCLLDHIRQTGQLVLFLQVPQRHNPEFRSLRWEMGTPRQQDDEDTSLPSP